MGRVLITSKGGGGAAPTRGTATPIVVTDKTLTGGGTGTSPLGVAPGMLPLKSIINPGFPAIIGTGATGEYTDLQIGTGLAIDTATKTINVQAAPGTTPIVADPVNFTGDGLTASPLTLADGGVMLTNITPIPPQSILGNFTPAVESPAPIFLDRPLHINSNMHLSIDLGAGLLVTNDQLTLDFAHIFENAIMHTGPEMSGHGTATQPLVINPGGIRTAMIEDFRADTILGRPDSTGTPYDVELGFGLAFVNSKLEVSHTDIAPAVHTHDGGDITGTIPISTLPSIPLAQLSASGAQDQFVPMWDSAANSWIAKSLSIQGLDKVHHDLSLDGLGTFYDPLRVSSSGLTIYLKDMDDVEIQNEKTNDILQYDGTEWHNVPFTINGGTP